MMVLVVLDEGDKTKYEMQKDNKKVVRGGRRASLQYLRVASARIS
jgi:hypothetical protein